jgi:hypothetical protein
MKRDCGEGELIPVKWELVYCPPHSDREQTQTFPTLDSAMPEWERKSKTLVACSDLRLYAVDKKGYGNPIMTIMVNVNGEAHTTDRRSEL